MFLDILGDKQPQDRMRIIRVYLRRKGNWSSKSIQV